ncbi:UDP-galactopyranose mutase [Sphingomonas bisphenolicum]|uniref:UDP-galactopyranose mutase n=1 Tax=Sphingomonas bisphenolicum TaxID=296544 RepID=A0ABN5WMN0_9SPHN|nr:UDP-galactopyranose mutase [Sphingomonas bisphenolicum]BBF70667.1 UDP-galactopyranose mutase [Sphingomonas bisphenolicum]
MTLVCFSHLRWDFVFQRPQHLMSRLAAKWPVLFWEEPVGGAGEAWLELREQGPNILVAVPHLPDGLDDQARDAALKQLLDTQLAKAPASLIRWYYTPMMLRFSRHLDADCTVYDCMDELANFRFAPTQLADLEVELFDAADLVFTGGHSLYEAKRTRHPSVHAFPSSVDVAHFGRARGQRQPLAARSAPRLGFYGVIDERMDLDLLAALADARPDWSLIMVGPVIKIDPAELPMRPNIDWLGGKRYEELPQIVANWDVALMPFAINDSTRFISPTKTPEYLAAGLPVVSTPITDVALNYGALTGVEIAGDAGAFVQACERAIISSRQDQDAGWRAQADAALSDQSWEKVVDAMTLLIDDVLVARVPMSSVYYDYLVVGAGFAGAVMAERLARDSGKRVLVIDRRDHIGGNAFDHHDEAGILVHRYGPHIFHTNSQDIVEYLSRFTQWRPYEHRVLADIGGVKVPMPINRTTLNRLYDLELNTDEEAEAYLADRAEPVSPIKTSADVVITKVGRELYETFFRGYTRKQWGMDPSELDKSVTARVPTRVNTDDRYFTDSFQAMPAQGYTAMFAAMLDHDLIEVELGVDFEEVRDRIDFGTLVFTGPIDEYFGHCYGKLPYRSLDFRHETLDQEWLQDVAVVNYPSEAVPYTRVTEYKHLTGQRARQTSVTYEYPCAEGDPYYPIPRPENEALFKRYEALALATSDVLFVGRLATYRYYNMDQVVGQALATYRRHATRLAAAVKDEAAIAAE